VRGFVMAAVHRSRRTIPVRIAAFVRDPDGNNVEAVCHA